MRETFNLYLRLSYHQSLFNKLKEFIKIMKSLKYKQSRKYFFQDNFVSMYYKIFCYVKGHELKQYSYDYCLCKRCDRLLKYSKNDYLKYIRKKKLKMIK